MQETAQEVIRELFNSKVGNSLLLDDFNLFDSSVSQKLWSAEYNLGKLISLDVNEFRVFPSGSDTISSGAITTGYKVLDIIYYCRTLNLLLDGFFMNSMSTLDTLAHELFTLYCCSDVPSNIYIVTARKMLGDFHPSSKTLELLNKQLKQGGWFDEFEPFRHCTTHVSLIRYDDIEFRFDQVKNSYHLIKAIRLPDNPQTRPFTYNLNRIAGEYCQTTLRSIQSLVADVYDRVLLDISANKDMLPIQAVK
jgi:hypothetical protein